ncbi:DUF222 domain-containing protein [Pseudoclavibacter endophyticus]|uniref:DUF222 domain-containing protein n=2 Tax=Pseudoclavibacter endophyticus TaxID=1778590 RepID=A0A6H9WNV3_9MICO|nr:HNH endonuclease signature motif containing protein [Pseudoclavibacter endophyticus]KAB1649778.1 DUF222 domain-containing protein [Pseudoclavibacter endophyticus]
MREIGEVLAEVERMLDDVVAPALADYESRGAADADLLQVLERAGRGVVAIRGLLTVDVAAQLQRVFDSLLNPKLTGPQFIPTGSTDADADAEVRVFDDRSRPQRQHDALATALGVAARSGELPELGGAAPTLVVSVRERDLAAGRGWAHLEGSEAPTSLAVAHQHGCAGEIQRVVLDEASRIVSIGVSDRAFNARQRRAIALRDGGCVIPGCTVPAAWCELHHVQEWAIGGPTHTDNGVALCWFHHRTIGTRDGWHVRMRNGIPEVLPPDVWNALRRRWEPATSSHLRLLDLHEPLRPTDRPYCSQRSGLPDSSGLPDRSAAPPGRRAVAPPRSGSPPRVRSARPRRFAMRRLRRIPRFRGTRRRRGGRPADDRASGQDHG